MTNPIFWNFAWVMWQCKSSFVVDVEYFKWDASNSGTRKSVYWMVFYLCLPSLNGACRARNKKASKVISYSKIRLSVENGENSWTFDKWPPCLWDQVLHPFKHNFWHLLTDCNLFHYQLCDHTGGWVSILFCSSDTNIEWLVIWSVSSTHNQMQKRKPIHLLALS